MFFCHWACPIGFFRELRHTWLPGARRPMA
ncbi:4Fe-4S binding protein [Shinella sp. CPCC 101442]